MSIDETKKLSLAFDIDGVLVYEDFEFWINYFETQTGRSFDRLQFIQTHNWSEATGLSTQDINDLYVQAHNTLDVNKIHPVNGARTAIQALQPTYDFHLVTARDSRIQPMTTKLLESHFGSCFTSHNYGHVHSKVEPIRTIKPIAFIEDSAYQAQLVAESGLTQVIYFPQLRGLHHLKHERHPKLIYPKTANELEEGMTQADLEAIHERTWQEIVDICQQLQADQLNVDNALKAL